MTKSTNHTSAHKVKRKDKSITVIDIANYLNISPSTVSRALNNNPKISQKTKEKVWEAAKQLGYMPNIPAYTLNSQKRTILIASSQNDIVFNQFLEPLVRLLKKHNFEPLISYLNSKISNEQLEIYSNLNAAALIMSLYAPISEQELKKFQHFPNPIFTFNTDTNIESQSAIYVDYYNAGYLTIKHLKTLNIKRVAIIGEFNRDYQYLNEFKAGLNSELLDSQLDINVIDSNSDFYDQLTNYEVVIGTDPYISCRLFCTLQHMRIAIPSEIMLISIGTNECIRALPMGLTRIEFTYNEAIEKFTKTIIKILNGEKINRELVIPAKLIIKTSSLRFK